MLITKITSKARLVVTAVTIACLLIACGSSATPTVFPVQPGQVETSVAGTLQAITPPASATSQPTINPPTAIPTNTMIPTSVPPTAQPPANPGPVGKQIVFSTGTTQTGDHGTIQAGQILSYYLKAAKGQPMISMVNSFNSDVTMSIIGQDGTVLLPASQRSSGWQGTLPSTQTYFINLYGGSTAENFSFSVDIAARIQFAAGQNSTTISGTTVNGTIVSYAAYAFGGQTLQATLNTSPDDAGLTIWGFSDGQPYARAQNGVTSFSMQLPSTQDYIIDVVPQGGRVINYILTITIK